MFLAKWRNGSPLISISLQEQTSPRMFLKTHIPQPKPFNVLGRIYFLDISVKEHTHSWSCLYGRCVGSSRHWKYDDPSHTEQPSTNRTLHRKAHCSRFGGVWLVVGGEQHTRRRAYTIGMCTLYPRVWGDCIYRWGWVGGSDRADRGSFEDRSGMPGAGRELGTHRTTSTWSNAHWSCPAPSWRGCHHRSITPLTRASLQRLWDEFTESVRINEYVEDYRCFKPFKWS